MPTSSLSIFKKSLLAAAIVTATGCASTGSDPYSGGLGDTLVRTGAATADLTVRAWNRTSYLLGLHDNDGSGTRANEQLADNQRRGERIVSELDEIDLALMEEDAVMPGTVRQSDSIQNASARIDRAITAPAVTVAEAPTYDLRGDNQRAAIQPSAMMIGAEEASLEDSFNTRAEHATTARELGLQTVALEDYTHEVGESETLWDIAKATTGDATNWHVIADMNNLAPDASVFPGQSLVIPADMLRPELAGAPATNDDVLVAEASERLVVPQSPSTQPAVAEVTTDDAVEPARIVVAADSSVSDTVAAPMDDAVGFEIEAGETLWDFAKRTTGDATYWQAIAAHNGFTDSQATAVREGQEVFVPDVLVRAELAPIAAATQVAALDTPATPASAEALLPSEQPDVDVTDASRESLEAGAAVLAGTNGVLDESLESAPAGEQDITIVEAAFRQDSEIDLGTDATGAQATSEIMISGTYYPKAVYNDADFSSSLLMRVSPGTSLPVSKVDGAWYQVQTEQGTGFVHHRDVK